MKHQQTKPCARKNSSYQKIDFSSEHLKALLVATLVTTISACGSGSSGTPATGSVDSSSVQEINDPSNAVTDNNAGNNTDSTPVAMTPNVSARDTGSNPLLYTVGNNNAYLTGPVFGSGEFENSDVAEELEIFGPVGSENLNVVGVYNTRQNFSSEEGVLIAALKNDSNSIQCGSIVEAAIKQKDGSTLLTSNGNPVDPPMTTLGISYSTTNINGDTDADDDCVPPGSIVYSIMNVEFGLGDLDYTYGLSAGITGGKAFAAPYPIDRTPTEPVVPLSYSVADNGDINVLVENQHSSQTLNISGDAIALSADGMPLAFVRSKSYTDSDFITLGPGESGEFLLDGSRFHGSASAMRVITDVEYSE